MAQSKIEWTDVVDNIIVVESGGWWCRRISPGCDHCYAEAVNRNRFFGGNGLPYRGAPPALRLRQEIIDSWARQRKPKKHFVASMTDVCGDWVPRWMIFQYLDGMAAAPRQTFQLLTKRADVILREVSAWLDARGRESLPPNIWPGVTVENQEWANNRRVLFEAIPAQTKFVSYEPALGPVNWAGWEFVSQIISGGESGPSARPAHPDWFRAARDWCMANQKAFFHKQNGEWISMLDCGEFVARGWRVKPEWVSRTHGREWGCLSRSGEYFPNTTTWNGRQGDERDDYETTVYKIGKQAAGRMLDGREWNEFPGALAAEVVAFGVSGGKDSDAMALATSRFLDQIRHAGPRVLIHADLGEIEHADSLPQCRRLAERLGLELIVVRHKKGGMIERWRQRWNDNVARYVNLSCVTLITPWSSAGMRFCTSEMKIAPITRELAIRFHGLPIINCVGIRGEESDTRAGRPISQFNKKLLRAGGLGGRDWNPIRDWRVEEVWLEHERSGFPGQYAYLVNGNLRVSCAFCVLSGLHDLRASSKDERNHPAYRQVVDLEIASTFSFQPSRWLADVRPDLLTREHVTGVERAKEIAQGRREVEAGIPKVLRFVQGWPTFIPSIEECALLADVRQAIGSLTGLPVKFTDAHSVRARYEELYAQKLSRG